MKFEHGEYALLDLVAAVGISFIGTANRVGDVLFEFVERLVKFPQEKGLFRGVRKEQVDLIDMAVGHAKNVIGPLDQIGGEHAAALLGNIDVQLLEGAHGVGAGRLALHGAHPGGNSLAIRPALRGVAKKALGHRTAADITRANEKNGLHSCDNSSSTLRCAMKIVNRENFNFSNLSRRAAASTLKFKIRIRSQTQLCPKNSNAPRNAIANAACLDIGRPGSLAYGSSLMAWALVLVRKYPLSEVVAVTVSAAALWTGNSPARSNDEAATCAILRQRGETNSQVSFIKHCYGTLSEEVCALIHADTPSLNYVRRNAGGGLQSV